MSNDKTVLQITDDPSSARAVIQALIDELSPADANLTWPMAQALTKLKEARFWLGEEMFGAKL